MNNNVIPNHFFRYFRPVVADQQVLRNKSFQIRHSVYCDELRYEEVRANGLEKDEFDRSSHHLLIQNINSGEYAGTVRLVCCFEKTDELPIEKFCSHSFYTDAIRPSDFPRDSICEISRLAVPQTFRKRFSDKFEGAAEGAINTELYSESEFRFFPFIAIGLYLEIAAFGKTAGIKHFFVMMEPRLARSMAFVGIKFEKLGDVIDYHGKRAPYYINHETFESNISPEFLLMLHSMQDALEPRSGKLASL